MLKFSFFYS